MNIILAIALILTALILGGTIGALVVVALMAGHYQEEDRRQTRRPFTFSDN